MPNKKEKLPSRYVPYYLIDPVRCDYEELTIPQMQKRIDRGASFIKEHAEKEDMIIINGRGYYITADFGKVWELL